MKLLAVATLLAAAACTTAPPVAHSVGTAPSANVPWTPPPNTVPAPKPVAAEGIVLPAGLAPGSPVTLAQVVDIALANNSTTRIAWLQARAAEAQLGSRRSELLPEVDLNAGVSRVTSPSNGGTRTSTSTTIGPSLTLSYLLFDFGGRTSGIEEARQTLIAADFAHNQAIQDVVLRTEQAYYDYLDAKALLAAQDATLKERQAELNAAQARHDAGVATIADVLQAKTAFSQAQLNRETIEGQLRTVEGALATAMGLPAATHFDLGDLPLDVPAREVGDAVESLIARAVAARPDLAAARANAERASARIGEVRAEGMPSIGLTSAVGETWTRGGSNVTPNSIGISLRWPLFTGFRTQYDVRQAELEAAVAREGVRSLEQQVNLDVWSSYFALQTANQRLTTARDLLASAQQSADVARERYRSGVGSILDLLTAEAALESARAQEVQARASWFVAVAELAHATGSLR